MSSIQFLFICSRQSNIQSQEILDKAYKGVLHDDFLMKKLLLGIFTLIALCSSVDAGPGTGSGGGVFAASCAKCR
jgi:hypothetical protein